MLRLGTLAAIAIAATLPTGAAAWTPGPAEGRIAYTRPSFGGWHVYSIEPDGSGRRQMTSGNSSDADVAWSPSGGRIAFSRTVAAGQAFIATAAATGGAVEQLTSGPQDDTAPAWSRDGSTIFFVRRIEGTSNIWRIAAAGGDPVQITDLATGSVVGAPTLAPDGGVLLFPARMGTTGPSRLYAMTAAGGSLGPVDGLFHSDAVIDSSPDWRRIPYPAGHSTNQLAFIAGEELVVFVADPGVGFGLEEGSLPEPIEADSVAWSPVVLPPGGRWLDVSSVSVSDRGTWLAYTHDYGDGYDVYAAPGRRRLTWDTTLKGRLSWAAAQRAPSGSALGSAGIVRPPRPRGRTAAAFMHCPVQTGSHGCNDRLALVLAGGHLLGVRSAHVAAGATRLVTIAIARGARRNIPAGARLRLVLRQRARGNTTRRTIAAGHAVLPAALNFTCPGVMQTGAATAAGGTLSVTAGTHARAAIAAAGRTLLIAALGPLGQERSVAARTDGHGGYTADLAFDDPGRWLLQADWGGDRLHAATPSPTCGVDVAPPSSSPPPPPPPPPPRPTSLTLTCPGKVTVGGALQVSGALTPAIAGAQISVTFSHDTKGGPVTTTDTVEADATGAYQDATKPGAAGTWTSNASYAGDDTHAASAAKPCATTVEP